MRSLNDVLDSSERQNLRSGALVIGRLCIVIIFGVLTLDFGIRPEQAGSELAVKTAQVDD